MTYLSVVIPAYNEASALRAGKLARLASWLAEQAMETELIVVDDGSADGTAELAESAADRVIRIPHAGKAAAIVAGIEQSAGRVVLFSDMDQATPITEAPQTARRDRTIGGCGHRQPGTHPARSAHRAQSAQLEPGTSAK